MPVPVTCNYLQTHDFGQLQAKKKSEFTANPRYQEKMLKMLWGVGLVQWGKNSPGFDPQLAAMYMWIEFIGSLFC